MSNPIDEFVEQIEDLHKQATEERSHYYTGSLLRRMLVFVRFVRAADDIVAMAAAVRALKPQPALSPDGEVSDD